MDEIHTYVQNKKTTAGSAWLLTDFGSAASILFIEKKNKIAFSQLWNDLRNRTINEFCSDYWKSYSALIPQEKDIESKSETFTIKGYNSRIRHYFARFKRKVLFQIKRDD